MEVLPDLPAVSPQACSLAFPIASKDQWEEAFAEFKAQAFKGGYGLNSWKKKPTYCCFSCEKYGNPRIKPKKDVRYTHKAKKQMQQSKKSGCNSNWVCKYNKDGKWHTDFQKYSDGSDFCLHNHTRNNVEGLLSHRCTNWSEEVQRYMIPEVVRGKTRLEDITITAQEQFGGKYHFAVTKANVSNERMHAFTRLLGGREPAEWLVRELSQGGFLWDAEWKAETRRRTHLFGCSEDCYRERQKAPYFVMADDTHSTQNFNLYMTNFVVISGEGYAPHLAFGLSSGKCNGSPKVIYDEYCKESR